MTKISAEGGSCAHTTNRFPYLLPGFQAESAGAQGLPGVRRVLAARLLSVEFEWRHLRVLLPFLPLLRHVLQRILGVRTLMTVLGGAAHLAGHLAGYVW